MLQNRNSLVIGSVVCVLFLCAPSPAQPEETTKQQAWAEILDLERDAFSLADLEDAASGAEAESLRLERIKAFDQLRLELREYMRKWVTRWDTPSYLKARFQEALYREYTEQWNHALNVYALCLEHPAIEHPDSVWKDQPLREIVEVRYSTVYEFLTRRDWEIFGHVPAILYEHQKGIDPEAFDLGEHPSHRSVTASEALQIARRTRSLHSVDSAKALGSALLDDAGLQHKTALGNGMIVFGVGADSDEVREFTQQLDVLVLRLRSRYFGATDDAPLLMVYADLHEGTFEDQERWGAHLAEAVHFRSRIKIEGYYEMLDHSIVLRRGVRAPTDLRVRYGNFLYGTPAHELVHALLQTEYPDAPRWLDEGLAALHEAYDPDRRPLDNYRLYFVRAALDAGKFPSLKRLTDPVLKAWGNKEAVLLAAAARYLCFYLYELEPEGATLQAVYHAMRDTQVPAADSPDAIEVLTEVTGLSPTALESGLRSFILGRDLTRVDETWGHLRQQFEHIVNEYIWPR